MSLSSLFSSAADMHRSKALYDQLHSRAALVKRTIHVVSIVACVYLLAILAFQFQAFVKLQSESFSPFGPADSRFALYQKMAEFAAHQWEQIDSSQVDMQTSFVQTWANVDSVTGVAVYEIDGNKLLSAPDDFTMQDIISQPGHSIVASAPFTNDTLAGGYFVIVGEDVDFKTDRTDRIAQQIDILLSALILGAIAGAYLLRSALKLLAVIRK